MQTCKKVVYFENSFACELSDNGPTIVNYDAINEQYAILQSVGTALVP